MNEAFTKGKFSRRILRSYISVISRVVLGGIFIYAGIVKIPHIGTLINEIEKYHILTGNLALAYGSLLPFVEILLGILLLLGVFLRVSALVSGLVVLSFAIAKASALIRGLDIDICPCFGPSVLILSVHSLAIDLLLLVLAVQLTSFGSEFLSLDALFSIEKSRNHSLTQDRNDSHSR